MINPSVPPPTQVEEITVQDQQRQTFEQDLTRSNWRFFYAMQQKSPNPGTSRRDDEKTPTR